MYWVAQFKCNSLFRCWICNLSWETWVPVCLLIVLELACYSGFLYVQAAKYVVAAVSTRQACCFEIKVFCHCVGIQMLVDNEDGNGWYEIQGHLKYSTEKQILQRKQLLNENGIKILQKSYYTLPGVTKMWSKSGFPTFRPPLTQIPFSSISMSKEKSIKMQFSEDKIVHKSCSVMFETYLQ